MWRIGRELFSIKLQQDDAGPHVEEDNKDFS